MEIVILGAGLGGLAAALRLGRSGHRVVVLDRDPEPPEELGDAFGGWERRGVRQWQQYHVFRARARVELERSLPDVIERLDEAGATSRQGDEFAGIPVRRPVLEWVLRHEVEGCEAVDLRAGTAVGSLVLDEVQRRVTGVRTGEGEDVTGDLVIDAAGRGSPVHGWIAAAGFDQPPAAEMSCGIAYHTRYYESLPGSERPRLRGGGVEVSDDGFMAHALAVGDAGTVGAIFVVPSAAPEFRALGRVEGWEAAVACIPRMAEVLDPAVRRPIMEPAAMYGLENRHSPWRADGIHGPRGLAHLGDTWLVTNPNLAWGSSIAIGHAAALADAVDEHGIDVDAAIDAYHERTSDEVEQLFSMACDTDRALQRGWGLPTEEPTSEELEREALLFAFGRMAKHGDMDLALRLGRRVNLLELPNEVWRDQAKLAVAREELVRRPFDPERRRVGLDRDDFLAAIAGASSA